MQTCAPCDCGTKRVVPSWHELGPTCCGACILRTLKWSRLQLQQSYTAYATVHCLAAVGVGILEQTIREYTKSTDLFVLEEHSLFGS